MPFFYFRGHPGPLSASFKKGVHFSSKNARLLNCYGECHCCECRYAECHGALQSAHVTLGHCWRCNDMLKLVKEQLENYFMLIVGD